MGVYVKNMGMPKNCFLCSLSILNGERLFCKVTHDEVIRAKRAADCPLIEVPPHGRLIDADALRLLYDFKGYTPTGDMTEEEFDRLMCRLPVIRQNIDDAPTIIEAEVEE